MTVVFNIFIFICIYCCLPIVIIMLRNETKPKKNLILGTTLPQQARGHEEVLAICAGFRRQLGVVFIILTLICLVGLFIPYSSISLTFYMCWLVFAITVPMVVYAKANTKLRKLKAAKGWRSTLAGKAVVDLKTATVSQKDLSAWWFLPPFIVTLIPMIATLLRMDASAPYSLWGYGGFLLLVAVFYLCYRFLYRNKAEAIDENSTITMALTRVRRYNWGKCWIWTSYLTALFTLAFWLFPFQQTAFLLSTLVYLAAIIYAVMRVEMTTRRVQQELSAKSGLTDYIDEDDYWMWGMFYYNPNDAHLIINNRIGINSTINLARPAGKVIIALTALLIAALPFFGLWMIPEEFTPVTASITQQEIVVSHVKQEYTIGLGSIDSVELLQELPGRSKLVGTDFNTLNKGKFNVQGIGKCNVCLDPTQGPFLLIRTDQTVYLINVETPEKTVQLYEQLCSLLES